MRKIGTFLALAALLGLGCEATSGGDDAGAAGGEGPGVTLDVEIATAEDGAAGEGSEGDTGGEQPGEGAEEGAEEGSEGGESGSGASLTRTPTSEELSAFPQCTAEDLTLTVHGNKVAHLELKNGGKPGHGLDVDDDTSTCAPEDDCEAGIDNQLGMLGGVANGSLRESLDDGVMMLVLEFEGYAEAGPDEQFALKMYTASIDPLDEDCDWQAEECLYNIRADSFDESCQPLMLFDNATIGADGTLVAGGPGSKLLLSIPLFGLTVKVPVFSARIEATASTDDGLVTGLEGVIGGAVPKSELIAAVEQIPDEEFDATQFEKGFVIDIIKNVIEDDIDSDGDGTPDGASIGIQFETIPGKLSGIEVPQED